ncbi:AbrB/MazE/SpoVT family DNA-binding domain-containing protein [Avibacterium paragallinarum]|uniref:AbrB/MazE/SpoVT family DNA-binding domain-containing protein n=1 Tax=Avibacterium TaxID=292486 RepID=UPI002ED92647
MQLTIKKWGNSVGIRIPAPVLSELQLNVDHLVDMQVENGKIIIAPLPQQPSLNQLLANIHPDNLHQEVDFGEAEGGEW